MTDAVTQKRQQAVKEIERIEQLPRAQQWRAARDLYLKLHPWVRDIDNKFIQQVRVKRDNMPKASGASKSGDTRELLDMPDYVYFSCIAVDRQLEGELNQRNVKSNMAAWNKFAKAFPEYCVARAI